MARPTLLYDSDCGICTSLKSLASSLDAFHRVDFLPIQSASGVLSVIPHDQWYACARMVLPDGSVASGGDAMIELLSQLPGGWLPARFVKGTPLGVSLARALYSSVSRFHSGSCSTSAGHGAHRLTTAWSAI